VDRFWTCAVLGGAIGAIGGFISGAIRVKKGNRNSNFLQTKAGLGTPKSLPLNQELEDKLVGLFSGGPIPEDVHFVLQVQKEGTRIALVDMSFSRRSEAAEYGFKSVRQTAVYFESDCIHFPKFALQPKSLAFDPDSGMVDAQAIEFPAHPEFSRAYDLTGVFAEHTRTLFNSDQLLANLSCRQGLSIVSRSSSLVLYRDGKLCEAEEQNDFANDAAEICRLLENSAYESALAGTAVWSAKEDIRAIVENMPGPMGKMLRNNLVTRADLNAFLQQALPRTAPANILRYLEHSGLNTKWVVSLFIIFVGQAFSYVGYEELISMREWGAKSGSPFYLILGLAIMVAGGCIAYIASRNRYRVKRLLREGRVCAAKIEKIEATGTAIYGERVHWIRVQFPIEGRMAQASCKIRGDAVKRAKNLVAERKSASILYDLVDPQRILFVDALLYASPEYEP
jgi:hypothetical protein